MNTELKEQAFVIPFCNDLLQECREYLRTPEIRVWCHPHKINQSGDDYCETFTTFEQAEDFIKKHPEAESVPLIAFAGKEINLYAMLNKD